jgi:hypothetical protein
VSNIEDTNTPLKSAPAGFQTRNILADDFGWEVPVETVPIPSQGIVYAPNTRLHGVQTVDIRSMTAREEDILTSPALIKNGTVIGELIKSCVCDSDVDVNNMLLGDRNAVMISIRITGYGQNYKADVTCPACSERSQQEFDLSNLEIKPLSISPVTEGENRFSFNLPVTKKEVHFKFLTGGDELKIAKEATKLQQLFPDKNTEDRITSRLIHSILSVDGIEDKHKIKMFIQNMPARDSRALRTYMSEKEPGVDMRCAMSCPSCDTASMIDLPIGINFFWPRE